MLKYAFLLDINTGDLLASKPKRKDKLAQVAIFRVSNAVKGVQFRGKKRIQTIQVNETTKLYGLINEENQMFYGVFADCTIASTRFGCWDLGVRSG